MPDEGANLIDEDKASNGAAATLFRSLIHCAANTHVASGLHTSGVTQLKKPCQSEAVPSGTGAATLSRATQGERVGILK
jgi:hypothetical protein